MIDHTDSLTKIVFGMSNLLDPFPMATNQRQLSPELGDAMTGAKLDTANTPLRGHLRALTSTSSKKDKGGEMMPRNKIGTGRIVSLAPEIISTIVGNLSYDQCVFSLRLTCRALESGSRNQFAKRFFTETYHMWAKWSLNELRSIAVIFSDTIRILNLSMITAKHLQDPGLWRGTQQQRLQLDAFMKVEKKLSTHPANTQLLYGQQLRKALEALPNVQTLRLTGLLEHKDDPTCTLKRLHPAAKRLCDGTGSAIKSNARCQGLHAPGLTEILTQCIKTICRAVARAGSRIETLELGCVSLQTSLASYCLPGPCCFLPLKSLMVRKGNSIRTPIQAFHTLKQFSAQFAMDPCSSHYQSAARLIHSMSNLTRLHLSLVTSEGIRGPVNAFFKELTSKDMALQELQFLSNGTCNYDVLSKFLAHISKTIRKISIAAIGLEGGRWSELFIEDRQFVNLERLQLLRVSEIDFEADSVALLHVVDLSKADFINPSKLEDSLNPCPHSRWSILEDGDDVDVDSDEWDEMMGNEASDSDLSDM